MQFGPSWYIDNQDVKLAPNDKIEVKARESPLRAIPPLLRLKQRKAMRSWCYAIQADFRALSGFLSILSIKCGNWFYWADRAERADRAESKESPVFMHI
jgi:hypothetical protein